MICWNSWDCVSSCAKMLSFKLKHDILKMRLQMLWQLSLCHVHLFSNMNVPQCLICKVVLQCPEVQRFIKLMIKPVGAHLVRRLDSQDHVMMWQQQLLNRLAFMLLKHQLNQNWRIFLGWKKSKEQLEGFYSSSPDQLQPRILLITWFSDLIG